MRAVVVGANRGVGLEFAKQLSDQGHEVFGLCRAASPELKELQVQVVEGCDVNDLESLKRAADKVPGPVDWLVHVAGILERDFLDDLNFPSLEHQLQTNAVGPLKCVTSFSDKLKEGSKVALLTSRMGSIEDNTSGGYYGYRMSKAALNMAGSNLAIDLKPRGVLVLLLHPGYVRTGMTGFQGELEPSESAAKLIRIIQSKSLSDTGTFWHANGSALPW